MLIKDVGNIVNPHTFIIIKVDISLLSLFLFWFSSFNLVIALIANGVEVENITEEKIWEEIYFIDSINWEEEKERLVDFFKNNTWILQGYTGRWNGNYKGGFIFTDFEEMFDRVTKDCDYIHIYDENGHLFLKCSHHDGTNLYEIKKVTEKGINYIDRWEYDWNDKRTEEYVHNKVMERYSTLPHFAHTIYGCPKVEYKKISA